MACSPSLLSFRDCSAPADALPRAGPTPERPSRVLVARDYRTFDILALGGTYTSAGSPLTLNATPADSYGSPVWDDLYALYVIMTRWFGAPQVDMHFDFGNGFKQCRSATYVCDMWCRYFTRLRVTSTGAAASSRQLFSRVLAVPAVVPTHPGSSLLPNATWMEISMKGAW